jgi:hypothetical protein
VKRFEYAYAARTSGKVKVESSRAAARKRSAAVRKS